MEAQPQLRNLGDNDYDDDFEFVTLRKGGDEVYLEDGSVGPVYPVFNRDLLVQFESTERTKNKQESTMPEDEEEIVSLQIPMRNLLIDDEERRHRDMDPHSSLSLEAGELESLPPGSYCVWTPDSVKASASSCKKSKSTGSSSLKRWKLLNLLRRSSSDGVNNFVFLSPSSSTNNKVEKPETSKEQWNCSSSSVELSSGDEVTRKSKPKASPTIKGHPDRKLSAHEVFYVRTKTLKEADKRRSYLPYKQDLVGFRATLGGSLGGKTFPPV